MCVLTGFGKNNHPQTLLNRLLLFVLFKFPSSFKRMLMGHERKRGCGLCEMSSQIDFGDQHGNRSCSQTWSCSQTGSSFMLLCHDPIPLIQESHTGSWDCQAHTQPLSCIWLLATLWALAARLLCPWDFSGKNTGLPFPTPGDLPDPGIEPVCPASSALQTDSLLLSHQGSPSLAFCLQSVKYIQCRYFRYLCCHSLDTRILSLGQEDLLEEGMATHSSVRAWRTPWIEEPGRLQSIVSQTVSYDWSDLAQSTHCQLCQGSLVFSLLLEIVISVFKSNEIRQPILETQNQFRKPILNILVL